MLNLLHELFDTPGHLCVHCGLDPLHIGNDIVSPPLPAQAEAVELTPPPPRLPLLLPREDVDFLLLVGPVDGVRAQLMGVRAQLTGRGTGLLEEAVYLVEGTLRTVHGPRVNAR